MSKAAVPRAYATAKRSYKPAQTSEPGFTLNKLNPDDFHEICGLTERVRNIIPDCEVYTEYFRSPDGPPAMLNWYAGLDVILPDGKRGRITGMAVDSDSEKASPFARVSGRLYHVGTLKRA